VELEVDKIGILKNTVRRMGRYSVAAGRPEGSLLSRLNSA
jgi:hypothetical protein